MSENCVHHHDDTHTWVRQRVKVEALAGAVTSQLESWRGCVTARGRRTDERALLHIGLPTGIVTYEVEVKV